MAAREGRRPGEAREAREGVMLSRTDGTRSAIEAAVLDELVQARAALLQLRALNGCTHYHDAMRAVSYAARALGVSPDQLNNMAQAAIDEGRA